MQHHNDCTRQFYYLGVLDRSVAADFGCSGRSPAEQRSSEERLIDGIESAQQWGKLPSDWSRCRLVSVDVTKHGLKVKLYLAAYIHSLKYEVRVTWDSPM